MKKIHILFVLIAMFLFGCNAEDNKSNKTVASHISVSDAYIRAMPPSSPSSAAFMTVTNNNQKNIKLVEVISTIAKSVELHEHQHIDGMMKMRQVDSILIPANGKKMLQPGGYHIMLIGLQDELTIDKPIEFTLKFDDESTQTLSVPVKKM